MIHSKFSTPFLATALALSVPAIAISQRDIRTERVQFEPGATSAVVEGAINSYEVADYVLGASAGQLMNVRMVTQHTGTYFNILPPGEEDVAMFVGSVRGNQYEGTLPTTGDYKIRVYMTRNAARRDESSNYQLEIGISAAESQAPASSEGDALVPGTDYNATGNIPCTMTPEQPTGSCFFGVTREGNGSGIVTVKKPDGRTRAIFFENGVATGYDVSQADPGEFSAQKQGDLNVIRIGSERYEIPDAAIFGG